MTSETKQKKGLKPGSIWIGFGIGFALLGLLLPAFMNWSGGYAGPEAVFIMMIPAAILIIIGYLRRIAIALENKSASND